MSKLTSLAETIDLKACESLGLSIGTFSAKLEKSILPNLLARFLQCPKTPYPPMAAEQVDPVQTPSAHQTFYLDVAWRAKQRVISALDKETYQYDSHSSRFARDSAMTDGEPQLLGNHPFLTAAVLGHACLDAIHDVDVFDLRDAILEIRQPETVS